MFLLFLVASSILAADVNEEILPGRFLLRVDRQTNEKGVYSRGRGPLPSLKRFLEPAATAETGMVDATPRGPDGRTRRPGAMSAAERAGKTVLWLTILVQGRRQLHRMFVLLAGDDPRRAEQDHRETVALLFGGRHSPEIRERLGFAEMSYSVEEGHCLVDGEVRRLGETFREGRFHWLCLETGRWVTGKERRCRQIPLEAATMPTRLIRTCF